MIELKKEIKIKVRPFPSRFIRSYIGWRKVGLTRWQSFSAAWRMSTI